MKHLLQILCSIFLCAGSVVYVDAHYRASDSATIGVTIEGTLTTSIAGIPASNYVVSICPESGSTERDDSGRIKGATATSVTDAKGHFRLTNIPPLRWVNYHFYVYSQADRFGQWIRDEESLKHDGTLLLEINVEDEQTVQYESCCMTRVESHYEKKPLLRVGSEKSTYSLGEILIFVDKEASGAKKYCEISKPLPSQESFGRKLMAFSRYKIDDKYSDWQWMTFDEPESLQSLAPKSQYLMCIDESSSVVGTYGNSNLVGVSRYYVVRLIRLADAKEWKASFVQSAPRTFGGETITWRQQVLKWLEKDIKNQ